MEIQVLFEDEELLIVNKPNNQLVHASYYARNIKEKSLIQTLKDKYNTSFFPIHRLDYKTSGALIIGKTSETARFVQSQFEEGTILKTYLALLRGYTADTGEVNSPVKNPNSGKYKEALTHFETLTRTEVAIPVQPYPQSRYSFVKFNPKTGRMHQLRKHANKISHPIIGDHKYGNRHHNRMFAEEFGLPNLFLHSYKIQFVHPASKKSIEIIAPLPDFWKQAFSELNIVFNLE